MNNKPNSGGFRRDTIVALGGPVTISTSRLLGGFIETPAPTLFFNRSPACKRPKGPITMPGIGERKKKGKNRSKY